MDLDFLGQPELSAKLENAYASAARDANLVALLPFYKCYRACVRGKVESLKHEETDVAEPEQREAALQAMRYFLLATRYAKGPAKPMLLVVCGMVASGKSTVARLLSARTGFPAIDSDRVRKKLAGISPTTRAPENYRNGIYSNEFTRLTYDSLFKKAEDQLAKGHGIIIDATFGNPKQRRSFTDLASRFNVPLLFLECRADEDTIRRRLKNRQTDKTQASDATWSVYEQMRADYRPPSEIPDSGRVALDTERELLTKLDNLQERF
jgi:predicted kinase